MQFLVVSKCTLSLQFFSVVSISPPYSEIVQTISQTITKYMPQSKAYLLVCIIQGLQVYRALTLGGCIVGITKVYSYNMVPCLGNFSESHTV